MHNSDHHCIGVSGHAILPMDMVNTKYNDPNANLRLWFQQSEETQLHMNEQLHQLMQGHASLLPPAGQQEELPPKHNNNHPNKESAHHAQRKGLYISLMKM